MAKKKGISLEEAVNQIKNKGRSTSKNEVSNRGSKDLEAVYKHNLRMQEQYALLLKHGLISEEDMNLYALYQTPTPYLIYETFELDDGQKAKVVVGFAESKDQPLSANQEIKEFFEFTYAEIDPETGNFIGQPQRLNYTDITDEMRENVKNDTHTLYQNCIVISQKYLSLENREKVVANSMELSNSLLDQFVNDQGAENFEEVSFLKRLRRNQIEKKFGGIKNITDKGESPKAKKETIYDEVDKNFANAKKHYDKSKVEYEDKKQLIEKVETYLIGKSVFEDYDPFYAAKAFSSIEKIEKELQAKTAPNKIFIFSKGESEDDSKTKTRQVLLSSTSKEGLKELEVYLSTYIVLSKKFEKGELSSELLTTYKQALNNEISVFKKQQACDLRSIHQHDVNNFDKSIKGILSEIYKISYPDISVQDAKEKFSKVSNQINYLFDDKLPCTQKEFSRYLFAKNDISKNLDAIIKYETAQENSQLLKNIFKDLEQMIVENRFVDIKDKKEMFNTEFFKKYFTDISYEDVIEYMKTDAFNEKFKQVYKKEVNSFNNKKDSGEVEENKFLLDVFNSVEFAAFSMLFDKYPPLANVANLDHHSGSIVKLLQIQYDLAKYDKHLMNDYNKSEASLRQTQTNITTVLSFPNGVASIFDEVDGLTILELSAFRHRKMYPNTMLLNTALHTAEMKDHVHCQATTYDYVDKSFNQKQNKVRMVNDFNYRKYIHRLEYKYDFEQAIDRAIDNFITNAVEVFKTDRALLQSDEYDFSLNSFLPSLQDVLIDFVEKTKIYEASFGNLRVPINIYIDHIEKMVSEGTISKFMDKNTLDVDGLRTQMSVLRDVLMQEYDEEPRIYNRYTLTESANKMFGSDFELLNYTILQEFFEQDHIKAKYPQIDFMYTDLGEQTRYINKLAYKRNVESVIQGIAKHQTLELKNDLHVELVLNDINKMHQAKNIASLTQEQLEKSAIAIKNLEATAALKEEYETKINGMTNIVTALELQQNEIKQNIANNSLDKDKGEQDLKVIEKLIKDANKDLTSAVKELERMQKRIGDMQSRSTEYDSEISNKKELSQALDAEIDNKYNKIMQQNALFTAQLESVNKQELLNINSFNLVETFLKKNEFNVAAMVLTEIVQEIRVVISDYMDFINRNENSKNTSDRKKAMKARILLSEDIEKNAVLLESIVDNTDKELKTKMVPEKERNSRLALFRKFIEQMRSYKPAITEADTDGQKHKPQAKRTLDDLSVIATQNVYATWDMLTNNEYILNALTEKDKVNVLQFQEFIEKTITMTGREKIRFDDYLSNSHPADFINTVVLFNDNKHMNVNDLSNLVCKDIFEKHRQYAKDKDINPNRSTFNPPKI